MSNYTKATNFTIKDTTHATILGAEHDTEYTAIQAAIATKADLASPTFTGTVTIPNPADSSDSTVAASTAFVRNIMPAGVIVPYAGSAAPDNWLLCNGAAVSRTTYATLFAAISTTFGAGDGSTTFNVPDLVGRLPIGAGTGTLAENVGAADVSTANDTFTVVSNTDTWVTGMAVVVTSDTTLPTTNPAGGFAGTVYVIRDSATTIKFASSLANAVAGTAIDITAIGSGTHTVTHTLTARTLGIKLGEEDHALIVAELPVHTPTDSGHTHVEQAGDSGGTARTLTNLGVGGTGYTLGSSAAPPEVYAQAIAAGLVAWNTASGTANIAAIGSSNAHNNMQPSLVLNYIIKT